MSGGDEAETGEVGRNPVYIGIMLIVCGIAVILNILVILLVYKFSKFRTSIDIFVTNLAASDIVHAGIVLPVHFSSLADSSGEFKGGAVACKITMFIPLVTISAAIYTMVAIAVDRYRVIVLKKTLFRNGALITIGVVWMASIVVSAPQLYEYNLYTDVESDNTTHPSCGSEGIVENFENIYALIVFLVSYCIPLVILIACYSLIISYLFRHSKRLRRNQNNGTMREVNQGAKSTTRNGVLNARNMRVLKTLFAISAVFIAMWTPYFILFVMTEVTGQDDTENFGAWPHLASRTMLVFSTASNAILYILSISQFRNALYTMVTCNRRKQRDIETGGQTRSSATVSRRMPNRVAPLSERTAISTC